MYISLIQRRVSQCIMQVTDPVCQSYGVAKVCIVEKVIMFSANPLSSSAFFPDRTWTKIRVYKNLSKYNLSIHRFSTARMEL